MPYKSVEDRRECSKRHYHENKAAYKARAKAFIKERRTSRKNFINWLKEQPCADCGHTFNPFVMDFDHLRDKEFNIGAVQSGSSWISPERLMLELQKCEVVCSNCHRLRTLRRKEVL